MAEQSGLAAGAQAGAAFGPWGAAIGGALGAASDLAKPSGGPLFSGQSQIDARSFMDGSGWTVSTGGGDSFGGARTQGETFGGGTGAPEPGGFVAGFGGGGGGGIPSWVWAALAVAVAVKAFR